MLENLFKTHGLFLPFPEPSGKITRRIYPLFLPFSGCATRCVFCAQDVQTGRAPMSVSRALHQAERDFLAMEASNASPLDLAFYGGTFTALPTTELRACLYFAFRWRERGLVSGVRCSTRPDALDKALLDELKIRGVSLIELGVQSFHDAALARSGRGYSGGAAQRGCELVLESGLDLGVQLMPGMPGLDAHAARADVELAARLKPSCVRLYPCLVLENTALAGQWRRGEHVPWSMMRTMDFLVWACLLFWKEGIPVIRMGLAEEPGLADRVLAGPRHPCLGSRVRGLALYRYLRESLSSPGRSGGRFDTAEIFFDRGTRLYAPRRCQGDFWGWRGELKQAYAGLGLTRKNVVWWDQNAFLLRHEQGPARREHCTGT